MPTSELRNIPHRLASKIALNYRDNITMNSSLFSFTYNKKF